MKVAVKPLAPESDFFFEVLRDYSVTYWCPEAQG
jgi:hypothetical protein